MKVEVGDTTIELTDSEVTKLILLGLKLTYPDLQLHEPFKMDYNITMSDKIGHRKEKAMSATLNVGSITKIPKKEENKCI